MCTHHTYCMRAIFVRCYTATLPEINAPDHVLTIVSSSSSSSSSSNYPCSSGWCLKERTRSWTRHAILRITGRRTSSRYGNPISTSSPVITIISDNMFWASSVQASWMMQFTHEPGPCCPRKRKPRPSRTQSLWTTNAT